jgi:hypothetical protein
VGGQQPEGFTRRYKKMWYTLKGISWCNILKIMDLLLYIFCFTRKKSQVRTLHRAALFSLLPGEFRRRKRPIATVVGPLRPFYRCLDQPNESRTA